MTDVTGTDGHDLPDDRSGRPARPSPRPAPRPAPRPPPRPPATARPRPRRLAVAGLPRIEPGMLVRVAPAGDRIVLAGGRVVATFAVELERDGARARPVGRVELPDAVHDVV